MLRLCVLVSAAAFTSSVWAENPSTQPATQPAAEPIPTQREAGILSDIRQLTFGDQFDRAGEAYFSPDMTQIIFQGVPKGEKQYQMYIMRIADRSFQQTNLLRLEQISAEPSRNTCGWFAPVGKTILFASTAGKEVADEPTAGYQREGRDYRWSYPSGMELWKLTYDLHDSSPVTTAPVLDPNSNQVASTPAAFNPELVTRRTALTDNTAYDAEGSFSPDGKHIIFTSNRTGDLELYAMKADGTGVVQLTKTPGYDGGPFFSPDGKRICYRSDRKSNNLLQVFTSDVVYNEQGNITGLTNEKQLTDDPNVNWGPFWHPNGGWIAWSTSKHGHANYEVYLMRDDGTEKTRVTYAAGADVLPAFSPDGKYMIWSSKRTSDNTTQVFVGKFKLPE